MWKQKNPEMLNWSLLCLFIDLNCCVCLCVSLLSHRCIILTKLVGMLLSVCYYKLLRGALCLCTFTTKKVIRMSQVLRNGLWWPLGILTAITPSFTPQIGPWEGHGCLWCLVKVIEVTSSYWFFLCLCRPIWPPLTMSCTPCRLL